MSDRRKTKTTPDLERRKRNRRAFVRWPFDFDVRLAWGRQSVLCRGYEIAEGGLSVVCEIPLPPDTEIDIEYRLQPIANAVTVKGKVRYVQGPHVGLEFLNLGFSLQQLLKAASRTSIPCKHGSAVTHPTDLVL